MSADRCPFSTNGPMNVGTRLIGKRVMRLAGDLARKQSERSRGGQDG